MHPNEVILTKENIPQYLVDALTLDMNMGFDVHKGPHFKALNEQCKRQGVE